MNKNIIKYLQGDASNNYLGSIIHISRSQQNIMSLVDGSPFALLLYYDHRTGRIERYLANSKEEQAVPLYIENSNYDVLDGTSMSFKHLNDGRVNNKIFNTFLLELFRYYFHLSFSYQTCDMNYIRNYTHPMDYKAKDEAGNIIYPLGSGAKIPGTIPLKGTKYFYAQRFMNLNTNKPCKLNIPQFLTGIGMKNTFLNHFNINIQPYKITSVSPEALVEIKRAFNQRKVSKLKDINDIVIDFNKKTYEKLTNLQKQD